MVITSIEASALESQGVFWRYTNDRYGRPVLDEELVVPYGIDPYRFISEFSGFDDWALRSSGQLRFVAEKATDGVIPILCLHKISREEDYGLTPERFRELLRFINDNQWYLISDLQYLEGDLTRVPTGLKPIVMGADDASHGNVVYQTRGDRITGPVKRLFGKPMADRDSMAEILDRYAVREEGRINFTFYVSFDAVPFRQLDGADNPGFPYRGVPVIGEKIRYVDENFRLGIHSLSHIYAHDMGPQAFAEDIRLCWEQIDEYAGGEAQTLQTMAFPFGIRPLTPEMRQAVSTVTRNGRQLAGAFDFNNKLAPPPGAPGDNFHVPRINVDNAHWEAVNRTLRDINSVVARRLVIWETDSKRLPRSRYSLGAKPSDEVWVFVPSTNSDLKSD